MESAAQAEAGGSRSAEGTTEHRSNPTDRREIDTLKATMRAAAAGLGLPRHELRVLEALIDIWQPAGGLWPEQATIATVALYGDRRTRTALMSLRERGLITWERRRYRGVQTSNLYQFTPKFWTLVREGRGGATAGNQNRPQTAKGAARRRQSVPTNGDLPISDPISLNGGGSDISLDPSPKSLTTPEPTPIYPPPVGSSHLGGGQEPAPLLIRVFAEERSKVRAYADTDHGTMRAEHLNDAERQLAAFVAEVSDWATAHGIAHERETVQEELARDLIRRWLAHPGTISHEAPRGFLAERAHPLGLLRGDIQRFGAVAVAAWKAAHTPKRPQQQPRPPLPPTVRTARGDQPGLTFEIPAHLRVTAAEVPAAPATLTASTLPAGPSSAPALHPSPSALAPLAEADETTEARERRKARERAVELRAWAEIHRRAAVDVGHMPAATTTELPASTYAPPKRYDPKRPCLGLSPERFEAFRALVREEQSAAELGAWNAYDAELAAATAEAGDDTAATPRWGELLRVARLGGDPAEHARVVDVEPPAAAEEAVDVADLEHHDTPAAAPLALAPVEPPAEDSTAEEAVDVNTAAVDATELHAEPPAPPEGERCERAAKLRAFFGSGENTDEPRPLRVTLERLRAFVCVPKDPPAPAAAPGDRFVERDDAADVEHQEQHDEADHERTATPEPTAAEAGRADIAPTAQESTPEPADEADPLGIDVRPSPGPKRAAMGRLRLGTRPRERLVIVAALASRGTEEPRAIEPEDVDAGDGAPARAVQLGRRRGPLCGPRTRRKRRRSS
jgi:hypothetical protein